MRPPEPPPEPVQPRPQRTVGLYVLLVLLPLLVLVPLLVYAGLLLHLFGAQARESVVHNLVATSEALGATIDRELAQQQESIGLVAAALMAGGPGGDMRQARALMNSLTSAVAGFEMILVLNEQGRVLASSPEGAASGTVPIEAEHRRALQTGRPVQSDLHRSELDGRHVLTLVWPAQLGSGERVLISARADPEHLANVLASQVGTRDAVATLLDRENHIVARTRDMERYFGETPSAETLEAFGEGASGSRRFRTSDGNLFLWAWTTTASVWRVALGVPATGVDKALDRAMLQLVLAGVSLLVLGVGSTLLLARRIARSVDRMAASTALMARGEIPPLRRTHIRQLDAVYDALQSTTRQLVDALRAREQALESERAARAAADASNREKDVFIATLSHELRNPLAPVRVAAAILQSPDTPEPRRHWAAGVIERQVGVMARLLDDLLNLSRISTGRVSLHLQPVELREVIDAALEIARPLVDARRHQLTLALPPEPVVLHADPVRLAQVFSNLLTNAAKYTDPGGRIDVSARREGASVEVHVRDNGLGLSAEELEQVFQRFVQVSGSLGRSQGGLGIGLSLVRSLVEMHGGTVHAESAGAGQGSDFIVRLPLHATAD
jgi:signal transduction histidine kinase